MRGGHTLIIAEKFDAAQRIASALSEGPPTKKPIGASHTSSLSGMAGSMW